MPINDRDPVNVTEAARILGTGLWAGIRRGHLTAREQARVERIIDRAELRESQKATIRRATREAVEKTRFDAKKKKAVDAAVAKATKTSRWW